MINIGDVVTRLELDNEEKLEFGNEETVAFFLTFLKILLRFRVRGKQRMLVPGYDQGDFLSSGKENSFILFL